MKQTKTDDNFAGATYVAYLGHSITFDFLQSISQGTSLSTSTSTPPAHPVQLLQKRYLTHMAETLRRYLGSS